MMTKAVFIAYYFPPVGGAGVQRIQKFVRYLPHEGFLPIVVAGPLHSEGRWSPQDSTLLKEIPPEVQIHRVAGPVPAAATKWKRRRQTLLAQPTSFGCWWVESATRAAIAAASDSRFVLATMPPFENAIVADAVSQKLGIPWVADLRDPWAVDEIQVYPTWLHRKIELRRMETLLSGAALVVMNTPEAVNALRREIPRLSDKNIISICNGFDSEDFETVVPARTDRKFRIVHAGSLLTETGLRSREQKIHRLLGGVRKGVDVLTRSPTILVDAITRWCERRPEIQADLEVAFAGNASGKDQSAAYSPVMANVTRFLGYLPHAASVELVRTADLLFLPMHNLRAANRATTAPGKTYEYMAAAQPILAAVPDGDAHDFLRQCGTAHICRPDDAEHMIRILDRVYDEWKVKTPLPRSNQDFVNRFERKALTASLANALRSMLPATAHHSQYLRSKAV